MSTQGSLNVIQKEDIVNKKTSNFSLSDRYINEDFLSEKKSLNTVYPGIQFPNIATHSNGETRNSMAFLGSLDNNIRQYRENVNLKRMEVSGLYLEHIHENERSKIVCNRAFANNPYAVNYFPEPLREHTYKTKVFETLDKKTIQTIPNELFIPSLQYFLQNTEQCGHQSKIVYNTLKKRLSETQKDILSQTVNPDKEPSDKEIVKALESWSEGNLYEKLKASPIPQNIQSISDSVLSFEQNDKDILEIIGKQFETDSSGKPTLNGMKSLSKAMEIYSDKHFETARYLFVKDGLIIRHIAVSSQTPSSTVIKPDENFLYNIRTYVKETGSQIIFLHNHPSGYVEPSEADIELTEYLHNFFTDADGTSYFSGHIILDHGTFGLYDSKERKWNALINDKILPLQELQKHYGIQLSELGSRIEFNNNRTIAEHSVIELAELAKKCDSGNMWNTKDWIPAFMMTGNGVVTSLEYINVLEFNNSKILEDKLKTIGREVGSESIIFIPRLREQFLICERFAQDSGKVREVIYEKPDGTFELSGFSNGNIFNDLRIDDIIIEDSEQNKNQVEEKLLYEQSVNKNNSNQKENKTMAKITDEVEFEKEYALLQDGEEHNINEKRIFNPEIVERNSLSESEERRLLEDFNAIGKFENAVGEWSEYSNITNFFDFHNHADEFLKFMDAAREEKEISGHKDNISFVQHYLENKLEIPIYKNGERISPNWTHEEREKYSSVVSRLNLIAQAIVKANETYTELYSEREGVIHNTERLELLGAKDITELEKTLQKIKDELNPQIQEVSLFEKESHKLSDLNKDNPSEIEREGLHKSFEYDGLTYIPVRSLSKEEKEIINNRTPKEIWENAIIEKPKNGNDYSLNEFIEKAQAETGNESADLFYCIEKGKFFTPVENGIVNLNENSINEHFNAELQKFYNSPDIQNIIKTNRPLVFDKTKDMELTNNLTSVISDGEVFTQRNENLGDIRVKLGNPKNNGISHIIKRRMDKLIQHDGKSYDEAVKETSAILFLAVKNISEAPATKETNGRYAVYKNGIKTAIDSDKYGRFVVTGFDIEDTKQEATDSIKSVNALYGYTPEFLEIYAQVGAAYASLSNNINYNNSLVNKHIPEETQQVDEIITNEVNSAENVSEKESELLKENTDLLKQNKQFEKMLERLTNEITSLRKENEAIKQQVFADKKQQSAQDSLFHDSHQENQVEKANNEVLLNPDGFGRTTAYKVDTIVPKFGIYNKNNEIEFIENARFSKFIENKVSPGYGNVILEIPQKDGKTVEFKMDEEDYNKLINAVDDLERMKQHIDPNSYEWKIAHSNYMAKLNLDENIYRLNSAGNFLHNFRIQCRHNNAHNPKQALKIAGIMFEQMPPLDRERHLSERRQYEENYGKGSYDLMLIKEYEENHGKININIDNIQKEIFNQEKVEEDMAVIYKTLKSGDEIENTKIKVGDSIPIAMTIKSSVNRQNIKLETQDWKIMSVQKGLNRNQAVLYNEAAKSYQTVPLNMLVNHIHKIEKSQAKEKQKHIKKQHKDVEMSL